MKRSIFAELWFKMVHSGSRLNLFIGINILVFLSIGIVAVFDLFAGSLSAEWLTNQLAMPAWLPSLPYKFWTPITYMFLHREFFHILFNMLWLYWMGRIFEEYLKPEQFTFTYIAGGLAGALFYLIAYNVFPVFSPHAQTSVILGASASVNAIVIAVATLLPDYTIMLLFFGAVRLKYLALAFVLIDFLSIAASNPGGSIAHLGGALLGFLYIGQLQSGNDWSKIFKREKKLKIVSNQRPGTTANRLPDQEIIDEILDKISKSGYESLSTKEKQQLFNASKKE
ncbi:MAG TPA: rhomboid family intramembrane serine protease [Sphingobacteriaceae bacterium]|nr:rhomboid family intramembrane serine protease [Sphingobacteriaceae bacterium]